MAKNNVSSKKPGKLPFKLGNPTIPESRLRLIIDETLSPIMGELLKSSITCTDLSKDYFDSSRNLKITQSFYHEQLKELTKKLDDIQTMLTAHMSHCKMDQTQPQPNRISMRTEEATTSGNNISERENESPKSRKEIEKKTPPKRQKSSLTHKNKIGVWHGKFALRVKNLSSQCNVKELRDTVFRRSHVRPSYCAAHTYTKGEGILDFYNQSQMELVMKWCDGDMINGKKISLVVIT